MKKNPKISASEWQVMRVVWDRSPIATNDVVDVLTPVTDWQPKTIMTLLNRLAKKGALGFEKKGRVYHYYPLVTEADCVREESRSFLERVYGGSLRPMLAHFFEESDLSPSDIEELKRILDKKGERR